VRALHVCCVGEAAHNAGRQGVEEVVESAVCGRRSHARFT
jgi:hypothetical protein